MDLNFDRSQLLKLTKKELIDTIILPFVDTVDQLKTQVAELESQLNKPKKDSGNSSTPPSVDFKKSSLKTLMIKRNKTIKKRLIKYRGELLLFLYKEKVVSTNNLSEQAIRPKVIHRKICYGHRSQSGKESFAVNSTVIGTIKKKKENLFEKLNEMLESKNIVKPKLQFTFCFDDTS